MSACGHWWIDTWGDHRCGVYDDHTRHRCADCDAVAAVTPARAPGTYVIDDAEYHADPALSSSQARRLLQAPAKYLHDRFAGERHTDAFDFGKAAHAHVLGVGTTVRVIDAPNWTTKAAKDAKADAHAHGETPVLAKDWRAVEGMAAAIRQHPIAAALLNPEHGDPEMSLFWTDPRTGANLRARFDWLPHIPDTGRLIIPDYKSTVDAHPRAFARHAASYGYHSQAAWYLDAAANVLDQPDAAFLFIAQEKHAPYLVTVVELDATALAIGRDRNRRAIDIWLECKTTGHWPAYADDVVSVALPRWAAYQHDDDLAAWPDPDPSEF